MLALVNSVHLAVFPFLDWKLDFLLHCLYRKTQTIQEDYVGAAVFRRKSCIWIKDTSQLHVQAPSSSQNKHPYHVFELKPHNRLHMSPAHSPWCKEGLYINEQQAASSCASSHLCVHVFPLGSICIKPPKCIHLRLEISIFSFFLCFILSLFQILSPDLTLCPYLAYFEGFGPELSRLPTPSASPDHASIDTSLCWGHFERCMTVDFQGCFISTKTQQEVSRGTRANWSEAQSPN